MFIKFAIPNKSNFIVGTMYKHPSMQHCKFNNDFLENVLNKIQAEKKFGIITDDFNLSLIKYSQTTGVVFIWVEGIRTFWTKKGIQEKSTKFIKIFELRQVFIYNFVCQNDLIPLNCIQTTRTKSILLASNTSQLYQ